MIRLLIMAVVCCSVVPAFGAWEDLKRSEGVHLVNVGIVGGEVRAGKELGSGWLFRQTPQGTLIYLAGGERTGAWSGWYLNYDHRGKDAPVGLVPEPGPGCYWTWSEGAWKKNRGGFGYTFPCTARPANGAMRGWSLRVDGARLILVKEAAEEITFRGSVDDLSDGK